MSLPMDFENMVLDHVAVAVNDLEASVKFWSDLGLVFDGKREVVEEQGVKTAFAPIDEHGHLELLGVHGESGPIQKYLDKKGPGIHHLCFRVKDVKLKGEELIKNGYTLINSEPIIGANNCLVNFIHPKSTGGVLIEISEKLN